MKIAKAIAGIATRTRAPRSERAPRRRGGAGGARGAAAAPARVAISGPRSGAGAPSYSASAASKSAREKSGHSTSVKHELRVGGLPHQVVREPLLAARADDQVGVVHLGRVEVARGTPPRCCP